MLFIIMFLEKDTYNNFIKYIYFHISIIIIIKMN